MKITKKLIPLATCLLLTLPVAGQTAAQAADEAPTHATGELVKASYERKGDVIVGQTYELANIRADSVTLKTYGCKGELLASDGYRMPATSEPVELAIGGQSRFGARSSELIFKKTGHASTTITQVFPAPAKCVSTGEVKPVVNHPRGKVFLTLKRSGGKIVSENWEVQRVRATFIAVRTYNCKGKLVSWVGASTRGKKVAVFKAYTRNGAHHSKITFRKKGYKPVVKRVDFPAPHRCV